MVAILSLYRTLLLNSLHFSEVFVDTELGMGLNQLSSDPKIHKPLNKNASKVLLLVAVDMFARY